MTAPIIASLLGRVLSGERAEEREPQAGSARTDAKGGTAAGGGLRDERGPASSAASPPDPLLLALDGALSGLEQALDDFVWPAVMTPSRFQRLMREYVHEDWPEAWPNLFPGLRAVMGSDSQPAVPPDVQAGARRAKRSGAGGPNAGNAVDQRLAEDFRAIFGGPPPPILTPALAGLVYGAQALIMAYNRLRLLLVASASRLRPELAETWRSALVERAAGLAWLGVEEAGRERILWARRREFLAGAARQPERAYDLLAGEGGLAPVWRETALQVRRQGLAGFIVAPPGPGDGPPPDGAGLLDLSG